MKKPKTFTPAVQSASINTSNMTQQEMLRYIIATLETLKLPVESKIYTNKELMEVLGIHSRYLKQLRDNGYIGYTRLNDKYWYTQADVDAFLSRFYYEAFSTVSSLPAW